MAKQIKPKYPLERAKQSTAFANGEVSTEIMTTHPRVIITLGGSFSDEIVSDLQNTVDEILKHHGK